MKNKCAKIQAALLTGPPVPGDAGHLDDCPKCREFARTLAMAMALPDAAADVPTPELAPILAQCCSRRKRHPLRRLVRHPLWIGAAAAALAVGFFAGNWRTPQQPQLQISVAELALDDELLDATVLEFTWDRDTETLQLAATRTREVWSEWNISAFDPISEEDYL